VGLGLGIAIPGSRILGSLPNSPIL